MLSELVIAIRATIVTLVLTGLAYPFAVTGVAQVLFPHQANGSLEKNAKGEIVGSALIGQSFANSAYFQPRPSAAGNGYDPTASSGSNLGPTSQKLKDRIVADVERLKKDNPEAEGPVPDELVTASASGLDPHISPESAVWQAPRIAKARGITADRLQKFIENHTEGRDLGFLGEPRVNVLRLNLALDVQFPQPHEGERP